jgi:hypothetical protein
MKDNNVMICVNKWPNAAMKVWVLASVCAWSPAQAQKPDDVLLAPAVTTSDKSRAPANQGVTPPVPVKSAPAPTAASGGASKSALPPPVAATAPKLAPSTPTPVASAEPKPAQAPSANNTKAAPVPASTNNAAALVATPSAVVQVAVPESTAVADEQRGANARPNPFVGRSAENEQLLLKLEAQTLRSRIAAERAAEIKSLREAEPPKASLPALPASLPSINPQPITPEAKAPPKRVVSRAPTPAVVVAPSTPAAVVTPVTLTPPRENRDGSPKLLGVMVDGPNSRAIVSVGGRIVTVASNAKSHGIAIGNVTTVGAEVNGRFVEITRDAARMRPPEGRAVAATPSPGASVATSQGPSVEAASPGLALHSAAPLVVR